MTELTRSQKEALLWLEHRNGTGIFDKNGVILAAGQHAPFMRSTWNELVKRKMLVMADKRRIEITADGRARCDIIRHEKGMENAIHLITERDAEEEYEFDC